MVDSQEKSSSCSPAFFKVFPQRCSIFVLDLLTLSRLFSNRFAIIFAALTALSPWIVVRILYILHPMCLNYFGSKVPKNCGIGLSLFDLEHHYHNFE